MRCVQQPPTIGGAPVLPEALLSQSMGGGGFLSHRFHRYNFYLQLFEKTNVLEARLSMTLVPADRVPAPAAAQLKPLRPSGARALGRRGSCPRGVPSPSSASSVSWESPPSPGKTLCLQPHWALGLTLTSCRLPRGLGPEARVCGDPGASTGVSGFSLGAHRPLCPAVDSRRPQVFPSENSSFLSV